jgi:hypothetical protein
MMKAIADIDGVKTLMLGLSFGNLRKFMSKPLDTFIKIEGKQIGLDHDVLLFSGETEAHMAEMLKHAISDTTIVHISGKLKS